MLKFIWFIGTGMESHPNTNTEKRNKQNQNALRVLLFDAAIVVFSIFYSFTNKSCWNFIVFIFDTILFADCCSGNDVASVTDDTVRIANFIITLVCAQRPFLICRFALCISGAFLCAIAHTANNENSLSGMEIFTNDPTQDKWRNLSLSLAFVCGWFLSYHNTT